MVKICSVGGIHWRAEASEVIRFNIPVKPPDEHLSLEILKSMVLKRIALTFT